MIGCTQFVLTGCGRVQIEFSEVFAKTWEQNWIQQDDPTIFSVSFSKLSDLHLASDAFLVNWVKINQSGSCFCVNRVGTLAFTPASPIHSRSCPSESKVDCNNYLTLAWWLTRWSAMLQKNYFAWRIVYKASIKTSIRCLFAFIKVGFATIFKTFIILMWDRT